MTRLTAAEGQQSPDLAQCWCCGMGGDRRRLISLGNHPEVTVCIRCAHSLSRWACELEDQDRTGISVRVRDEVRRLRKIVVRHGWHHNKVLGHGLRWFGRFTP